VNKYKICVYAVCKDEEQFVDRFMSTLNEADLVVIGDTGSTDKTAEYFRANGAIVYDIPVIPWRFDKARNELLKFIPDDIDICVALDVDEVINPGWRKCLEDAWTPTTTRACYLYTWSFNPDGTPGVQFNQHRFHSRHNYKWKYPTHEILEYTGSAHEEQVFVTGLKVDHFPDETKNRGFNVSLLELALEENPDDCRNTNYLGREYMFLGRWNDSIETLKKYLSYKDATWKDERCASMRWIANSYYKLGNKDEAYSWYYKAIAEVSTVREPYVEFAKMAYEYGDWSTVFYMVEAALRIKEKSTTFINMAYSWDYTLDDLGAISCYQLGLFEKSLAHALVALEMSPQDARLKNNLEMIKNKINTLGEEK